MIWIRLKLDLLPIIAQEIEKVCQEYMEELEQFYDENYADYRIGYFEKLKLKLRKVLSPQIDVNRMIYDETQGLKKQKKLKDQQKSQVQVQIVNNTKSSQKQQKEMGQESYQQSVQNTSPRKITQNNEKESLDQHKGSEKHKLQRNKEQQNQIQQSHTPEKQIKSNIQINKNATNYQKQSDKKQQISQTQSSNRQTAGDRSSKSPYRQTIHSQNRQNQKKNLQQAPSKSPNKTIEKNKIMSKNQTQKNLQQIPNSTSRKTLQSDLKSKTQTSIKKPLPHQLQENKNQRENQNIIQQSKSPISKTQNQKFSNLNQNKINSQNILQKKNNQNRSISPILSRNQQKKQQEQQLQNNVNKQNDISPQNVRIQNFKQNATQNTQNQNQIVYGKSGQKQGYINTQKFLKNHSQLTQENRYLDNQSQNFVQQQQQNLQQNEQQQQDDLVFTIRMSKEEYLQYLQAKQ
ncbi:hypothetical protein PPERSA_08456 [Pseudocohnilembus persalinus]|uniref:Uncharacterized protein n=1 Tax=Pseudocohnilembus persalinus TaxID=266149 RepID=A0A0V0R762_PSEPJ|nr:hypothetical protein PPERSA_08456 [Pseudocohnilembus persalinus]|eukprot:KRX10053.1 hypothetical protein PPERSA_08456 [Pseudocohnilembus persalinus]